MTIAEQIRADMISAMKNKESEKLMTLRGVLSGFMNEMVANGGTPQTPVTDDVATTVIKRSVKQRKDSIEQFTAGGRPELAATEETELAILEHYLPAMMDAESIRSLAIDVQSRTGIYDIEKQGILIGAVMKECQGNADGSVVKQIVSSLFT